MEDSMPTITINLSEEFYERLAGAVEESKLTAEDFILLAIADKLSQAHDSDHVDAEDDVRYAAYLRSGESVSLDEAFAYLEARLSGQNVPSPVPRKNKV
jgi:hypothetical protein